MLSDEVWVMLRYLRIAFSVTCGIACVLLIVLWVRSYSYMDYAYGPNNSHCSFTLISLSGRL
jgi:hypothetical protein